MIEKNMRLDRRRDDSRINGAEAIEVNPLTIIPIKTAKVKIEEIKLPIQLGIDLFFI
jgi:hypothetical protein